PISSPSPFRDIAISPGGNTIVFQTGVSPGDTRLFARGIGDAEPHLLTGPSASAPFFSPDGRWVGFLSGRELRRVAIEGGPSSPICTVDGTFLGATWTSNDQVVFGAAGGGVQASTLQIVPANGGTPRPLTSTQITPGTGQSSRFSFP